MWNVFGILIFVGIVALVGVILIVAWLAEKKRDEKMREVANELGLDYFPEGNTVAMVELGSFSLLNSGRSRKQTKLIQGVTDEVKIAIFDYQYTTGGGKNSHTHRQSVASLRSDQLVMPAFTMRPENVFSQIGGLFGMKDIDFESHPQFSKMFVLKGPDEQAIRDFFTPPILTYFENHRGLCVEAFPGSMIFYWPGKRIAPEEIRNFLTQAYEVYGLIVDSSK